MTRFLDPPDPAAVLSYLDVNNDGRLSAEEYAATGEATKLNRRDFVMFDTNGDGFLSLDEFSLITNGVEAGACGPSPILREIVSPDCAPPTKAFNDYNERPDEEFDSRDFVRKVSALFSNLIQSQAVIDADPDRSSKVRPCRSFQKFSGNPDGGCLPMERRSGL